MVDKIIFLDVDGVLNSERTIRANNSSGYYYLDPVAVGLIRDLVDKTGAKIVVSSTWRYAGDHVTTQLYVAGFHLMDFHNDSITPVLVNGKRGDEVNSWLSEHPEVETYVCIDDDSDFFDYQNLINVDGRNGFSAQNHQDALDIFKQQE